MIIRMIVLLLIIRLESDFTNFNANQMAKEEETGRLWPITTNQKKINWEIVSISNYVHDKIQMSSLSSPGQSECAPKWKEWIFKQTKIFYLIFGWKQKLSHHNRFPLLLHLIPFISISTSKFEFHSLILMNWLNQFR